MRRAYDVFVVGAGGTGSEVVGRLAGGSLRVGIAERDRAGGECNWNGCVPTKAMLRATTVAGLARSAARFGVHVPTVEIDQDALRRRVLQVVSETTSEAITPFLERGVDVVPEEVRLVGSDRLETSSGERITARRIVLATGSEAMAPPIPGLAEGPYWTNRDAIWHRGPQPTTLLVIGGGAIGAEFAQIYARTGSRVTLVEAADQLLPGEEAGSAAVLEDALGADGVRVLTGSRVERVVRDAGGWSVSIDGRRIDTEELLVATGRRPALEPHDLAAAGIEVDDGGRPKLDATLRTTNHRIWVAGDATGELLFTHVGDYEASVVADDILGRPRPRDYRVVPRVTYTDPEVASVGLTRHEAVHAGHDVAVGSVPFVDVERACIDGIARGHVQLVADRVTGELLGGHIAGPSAGELIHEIVIAMHARIPATRLAGAVHAYPTLAQGVTGALGSVVSQLAR